MRRTLAALSFLIATATAAQAVEILSGGPLYGGSSQRIAVCYLFNAGTTTLTVNSFQIVSPSGNVATLTSQECGATLAAKNICGIAANVSNSIPYVCRFAVSPSKSTARGILEMRTQDEVTLQNTELQ